MKRIVVVTVATAVSLALASCSSCNKKEDAPPPPKKVDPHGPPQMPMAGTDADNKRIAALDLQKKIDAGLATFQHDEKPMAAAAGAPQRKAECWWVEGTPRAPKKLVISDLDASGAVQSSVDMYFDDKGMLEYAHAPDGHFVFHMEGLALWLDPQQRVKRGVKPQDASARAKALKKDMNDALALFKIR